jgi:type I restriction enzyme, S subunit
VSSLRVPKGWASVPLAQLAAPEPNSITDGPFGSKLKTEHYTGSGPRVVRLQNIGDGIFVDEHAHISTSHFETLRKHQVFAGDLVIAALGHNLPRACVVPPALGLAIVKADCIRFKADPAKVSNKYLLYALNSPQVREEAAAIIHGVGRPRLNQGEIKSLSIPLAPRNEQDRVVAELEKQLTRIDAGVEALRALVVHLARYRAGVLEAACRGRLIDETEPPARTKADISTSETFPEAIASARAKLAVRKRERAPFRREAPHTLPKGWCWATLAQLAWDAGYGTSIKCDYDAGCDPVLRIPNISKGAIDCTDLKHATSPLKITNEDALRAGDLLVVRTNGTKDLIGRGAVVCSEFPRRTYFASYLIRFRLVALGPLPAYIALIWNSPWVRRWVESHASNSAGQYNVNLNALSSLPLPIPPPAEATRIIAKAEATLSVVASLEVAVARGIARADRLRASLLRSAFEGRLLAPERSPRAPVA